MLSFFGLNTLPKQFIDYLVTSDEDKLCLNYNFFEYLPYSFALLATSRLKWISLIENNLQVLPSWMEDFKNLEILDLRRNPALSKESIEELQKKLPDCKISYDL